MEETPPFGAGIHSDSIWFLMPGRWGTVQVSAFNAQSEPVNLLITTSFDNETTLENDGRLQFGRRIWVPAHARVHTSHNILTPMPASQDQQSFKTETMLFDTDSAPETPVADQWGQRYQPGTFRIGHDEPVTVILSPASTVADDPKVVSVADVVYTARYERSLWQNVTSIVNEPLAPGQTALDAVDQLVIADDRVTQDLFAAQGIREWLFGGGMLWVMLDRVDARVLEAILGDSFDCGVVDRVRLTQVAVESGPSRTTTSEWSTTHEQPVDFVRVVTGHGDVEYTVNGWPAAIRMHCGQGQLLVTTLSPAGWVRPRTPQDPAPSGDASHATRLYPGPPLQQLAADFFVPRHTTPLPPDVAEQHVREYVGYSIPSRSVVVGMISAFVILLAGLSLWFSRSGRLEWMGVFGPVAALTTGGLLVAVGQIQRQAVPASVAALQFVQPIPGTNDVRMTATAGVYSPNAGDARISGTGGGWLLPDMTGMEETTRQLIWTDLESWQWENLPSAPGLRTARLLASQRLPEPVHADFELDQQGVAGRLSLPDGLSPTDGVLATRRGRIAVEFEENGTLRAPVAEVLTDEQYLAAGVLTDEQARRSTLLQQMLSDSATEPFPEHPTLLFWTEPWDGGVKFDERFRSTGSALVAMPVTFRRPAIGARITIPAPLLPYREAIGVDGSVPTGVFDFRELVWIRKSVPTSTWLQFQVPPSLLPIEPQTARLVIRVDGPVGKLTIAGTDGADDIRTWVDPVGTLELTIDDPQVLSLTGDGRLLLKVAGGDPDRPELTHSSGGEGGVERVSYWRIESLSLELTAIVTGRSG